MPTLAARLRQAADFLAWAVERRLRDVSARRASPTTSAAAVRDPRRSFDLDRSTTGDQTATAETATYWDRDGNGVSRDDERDEDADGLTNYDEATRLDDAAATGRRCTRRGPVPDRLRRHAASTTPTATATASSTAPTTRTSTTSRTSWSAAAASRSAALRSTTLSSTRRPPAWAGLPQPVQPVPAAPQVEDLQPASAGRPGRQAGLRYTESAEYDLYYLILN